MSKNHPDFSSPNGRFQGGQSSDEYGWFTYATDSQCARAPPPHGTDPDASELPFCRDLDGFVYEPEPWELARQLRLQRHAQQRDQLAGVVIYDGDCNASSDVPGDADPGPATAEAFQTYNQLTASP